MANTDSLQTHPPIETEVHVNQEQAQLSIVFHYNLNFKHGSENDIFCCLLNCGLRASKAVKIFMYLQFYAFKLYSCTFTNRSYRVI